MWMLWHILQLSYSCFNMEVYMTIPSLTPDAVVECFYALRRFMLCKTWYHMILIFSKYYPCLCCVKVDKICIQYRCYYVIWLIQPLLRRKPAFKISISKGKPHGKIIYDKRYEFSFHIVNFPFLNDGVPLAPL